MAKWKTIESYQEPPQGASKPEVVEPTQDAADWIVREDPLPNVPQLPPLTADEVIALSGWCARVKEAGFVGGYVDYQKSWREIICAAFGEAPSDRLALAFNEVNQRRDRSRDWDMQRCNFTEQSQILTTIWYAFATFLRRTNSEARNQFYNNQFSQEWTESIFISEGRTNAK